MAFYFQTTIVKHLVMDFEGSYEFLLCHKYFWSTHFWQWNAGPFKTFWNLHENAFCFFIFSKWNITTSLLMIHLKCTVVHYANLKFKHRKQAIFKLRAIEYAISFFQFLIYVYFNEAFLKNFMEKLSFFNTKFTIYFKM